MKKITIIPAMMLVLSSFMGQAQTVTAISPTGAGGFESGPEFADNGWTVQNGTYGSRKWFVGTGISGYSGDRAAFIGNSATAIGAGAGNRNVHFYRSVTIPTTATNIKLKFKVKQEVVATDPASGGPNDYVYLSIMDVAPTGNSATPTTAQFGGKYPGSGTTPLATFTEFIVDVPATIATGEPLNLVISYKSINLNTAGTFGWGAIDDIELTYTNAVAGADDFSSNGFAYYPNPVNDVLTLNYTKEMTAVTVTNMLGQQVISKKLNATNAALDMSSLAKGTYMVTVQAGNDSKTIKIVK